MLFITVLSGCSTISSNGDKEEIKPHVTEIKSIPTAKTQLDKQIKIPDISLEQPPKFIAINNIKEKKQAFFEYLYPLIVNANKEILAFKNKLHLLIQQKQLNENQSAWLIEQSKLYKITYAEETLLNSAKIIYHKIGVIPASLALAQAANESAWGTSRFALKGNNYFGQWCYRKGCGLVPKRRTSGSFHEVRKFDHVYDSVRAYIFNLNSNGAYKALRAKRIKIIATNKPFYGSDLTPTLLHYSERGEHYVKEINAIIRVNKLSVYDKRLYQDILDF